MSKRLVTAGVAVVAIAVAVSLLFAWSSSRREATNSRILLEIASIVEIEPIKELRDGFKEGLTGSPIAGRIDYIERNAQGDAGLINQIASEIPRLHPRAVYVLGTPLAQAIQKQNPSVLLLQGAVTDPVSAGLANSWQGSGRPYAATSDRPPVALLLDTISRLTPDKRKIGVLYNPGESNSVAVVAALREASSAKGYSLREFGVGSVQDLPTTIASALARSDVLIVPPDNTVTSGLKAVIQSATQHKIPVYATTADAVTLGALASVSTDFRELGRETADIAIQVLVHGKNPAVIPIQLPRKQQIIVSSKAATTLGVPLSPARSAGYVIR
jgi:putative ABC transport system substrate-binding protein